MDENRKLLLWFVVLAVAVIIICFNILGYLHEQEDIACQELGFESYKSVPSFKFCVDENGNLHYIIRISSGWNSKPEFKEISVGDVRVVDGGE